MRIRFLWGKLLLTMVYIGLVIGLYILGIPCLFLTLFKISCPGCGMTHAWLSLLQGEVLNAFYYHPMFWTVPIIYLFIFFDGRLFRSEKLNKFSLMLLGTGFFLTWLWRIIL